MYCITIIIPDSLVFCDDLKPMTLVTYAIYKLHTQNVTIAPINHASDVVFDVIVFTSQLYVCSCMYVRVCMFV